MLTTLVIGSPRPKGNSNIAADYFKKGLAIGNNNNKTQSFRVYDMHINPCIGCGYCEQYHNCFYRDDMQTVYTALKNTDLLVFITPIYFASITGQLKIFLDRLQPFYSAKFINNDPLIQQDNKQAALISVSGMEKDSFFENAKQIIKVCGINLNIPLATSLHVGGVDKPGDILTKEMQLEEIVTLGKKLPS